MTRVRELITIFELRMYSVNTLGFFPYHKFLILKSVFHINGGEQDIENWSEGWIKFPLQWPVWGTEGRGIRKAETGAIQRAKTLSDSPPKVSGLPAAGMPFTSIPPSGDNSLPSYFHLIHVVSILAEMIHAVPLLLFLLFHLSTLVSASLLFIIARAPTPPENPFCFELELICLG